MRSSTRTTKGAAVSNRIGRGRESFWPASPGRLNRHQILAAVRERDSRYRRIWPVQNVFKAPRILRDISKYDGPNFKMDVTGPDIIHNSNENQFDNGCTLSNADALFLIELMCWYAQGRIDGPDPITNLYPWEPVPDTRFTVRGNGTAYLQVSRNGNPFCQAEWLDSAERWIVPHWSIKLRNGRFTSMEAGVAAAQLILPDGGLEASELPYRASVPQLQPPDTAPKRPVQTPSVPDVTGEVPGGTYNERIAKIVVAMGNYPVDGRRTKRGGKPFVRELEQILDFNITAGERNAAWRKFKRQVSDG